MALVGKAYAEKVLRGQVKDFDGNIVHVFPEKLTFTGAVEAVYDGKKPLEVNIPREAQITEAEKEEIVREVSAEVRTEVIKEVQTEMVKEETVTVITEEVLKQMNSVLSGKWHIAYPENIKESIVAAMIQQVEFETTFALYDDGLVMPNDTNQVVSTHAAKCNAIEIQYQELLGKTYVLVLYHVERSDDALMDVIKTDDGQYIMLAYMQGKWNCPAAAFVDFGVSQNVGAEFKEAFSAIAVQSDVTEAGGTLLSISVTEAADGSVTMVNTLDSGTETIVIGADENGNPNKLTYNGKEIPVEWVVSE